VPILVVLLLAGAVQTVSDALLQYSGFFRSLAYSGAVVMIMMILMTAIALVAKFDLMEFLAAYAAVYAMGAVFTAVLAICGPIHATVADPQQPAMSRLVRMLRARHAPST
jgi:multidrug transporter EmrE-like cation transporter